jgi:hypothetical protein
MTRKTCTKCDKLKACSKFARNPATKDGRANICKGCKYDYDIKLRESNPEAYRRQLDRKNKKDKDWADSHPELRLLRQAKRRAVNKGVPFSITVEDIRIPKLCPYLGIKLFRGEGKMCSNSPSVDEIIPGLGYVPGNVQIVSSKANGMKNNASPEQLVTFCTRVLSQIQKRKT